MKYLNIIEKFKVLFDMLLTYKLSLIFLVVLLIATILYTIKKISTKKFLLLTLSSLIFLFSICYINNYKVLSETFDNFWTIFFTNIYFPSVYVYLFTLFTVDISLVMSFLNKSTNKIYRIVNCFTFVIIHIIFIIILNIISEQKINIFEITSLYANVNLVAVLELSINVFIVWMFILVTIYLTNTLSTRLTRKNKIVPEPVTNSSVYTILQENLSKEENETVSKKYKPALVNNFENIDNNEKTKTLENTMPKLENPDKLIQTNTITESNLEEKRQLSFADIINNVKLIGGQASQNSTSSIEIVEPKKIANENIKSEKNINLQDIVSNISASNNTNINDLIETKKQKAINNLEVNNISLNELSKDEPIVEIISNEKVDNDSKDISNVETVKIETTKEKKYTAKDYKKAMEMLEKIAPYHMSPNIKVSEAVAISLINNYSYDDCMMFKDILESCLAK